MNAKERLISAATDVANDAWREVCEVMEAMRRQNYPPGSLKKLGQAIENYQQAKLYADTETKKYYKVGQR